MNAGLVDLIATIRGIVRRPTDFTIQLFQILVQFPRASFLSIFFFLQFHFSFLISMSYQTRAHFTTRGIRKLQLRHATTQPDLKLNYHGIIVDSDSALRWYELFTTFRSRHYFLDCSVNTAIFPFREILRYASWFNNDGVEIFLSRDHCALFA